MGSFISFGFVNSENILQEQLVQISNYLSRYIENAVVKYPLNGDSDEWVEYKMDKKEKYIDIFNILYNNILANSEMNFKIGDKTYHVIVSVRKEEESYSGILFEIPEDEIFDGNVSKEDYYNITDRITNMFRKFYEVYKFDYCFCDSEADIDYSLKEIQNEKGLIYSILLYKDKAGELIAKLGDWEIDGLTLR